MRSLDWPALLGESQDLLGRTVSVELSTEGSESNLLALKYGSIVAVPEVQDGQMFLQLDDRGTGVFRSERDFRSARWVDGIQMSLSVDLGAALLTITPL